MDHPDGGPNVKPKLVIFDCDGVLVETESITDRVLSAYFTSRGAPMSAEKVRRLFTGGTMESAGEEAARRGADLPKTWLSEIYELMFHELGKGVEVFDGLFDLLDTLDAQGIHRAVASNGPTAKMKVTLSPSGLWDRFDGRIFSRESYAPKPHPEMLLAACKQAGVLPAEAIMVDDTPTGTKAADAAQMRAVGFSAASDEKALLATGHPVARTMAEVRTLLGV